MTNEGRKMEQEKRNERHERKNGKKRRHERCATLACSLARGKITNELKSKAVILYA